MKEIYREILIPAPVAMAFYTFVRELGKWWPSEYTWGQDALQKITIDPFVNGHCTEIGPYNFRCDWGRVTAYVENELISFKWQISPQRIPEPAPDKGSDVEITFKKGHESNTSLIFIHKNFENHGEGAADYQKAMDSQQGWDYILKRYVEYTQRNYKSHK